MDQPYTRGETSSPKTPLALYIHVPFCGQRCSYCHFQVKILHPSSDPKTFFATYTDLITEELSFYGTRYGNRPLSSVFYGGGTPSRLGIQYLTRIQAAIGKNFELTEDCEISMEINPEDGTTFFLTQLADLGMNRVSFGVQSFFDQSLEAVRRPHGGSQARRVLERCPPFARGRSLDLMLGLPFQTSRSLQNDLETAHALKMEHLSIYMLERDLPTPLDKQAGRLPMADEDEQADLYEQTCDFLLTHGYEHYEISNFCLPGFQCRHNMTYWTCGDYLGIGPAAHGRIGTFYWANNPQLKGYEHRVRSSGRGLQEQQNWSPSRFRQERIIQGLRLAAGIPLSVIQPEEQTALVPSIANGLIWQRDDRFGLTRKGRLLANEVFEVFIP